MHLQHDLGKVGMPGNPQYLTNEPAEEQMNYGIRLMHLIDLNEEEVQGIVYHEDSLLMIIAQWLLMWNH